MLSEEWRMGRLARATASEWHYWMGDKPYTQGAMSYLYRKLGEESTGLPCRDEVNSIATEHGHKFESEGLVKFGKAKGLEYLVTQTLIVQPDSRFSCTPDALIVHSESEDKLSYNVSTVEMKAPYSYDAYVGLALCKTPADVKKENKIYYAQVLFQMDLCDALKGYLCIYQPFFRFGQMNIVEFRKKDLLEDFRILKERKILFEQKFNEVREELFNLKY